MAYFSSGHDAPVDLTLIISAVTDINIFFPFLSSTLKEKGDYYEISQNVFLSNYVRSLFKETVMNETVMHRLEGR